MEARAVEAKAVANVVAAKVEATAVAKVTSVEKVDAVERVGVAEKAAPRMIQSIDRLCNSRVAS